MWLNKDKGASALVPRYKSSYFCPVLDWLRTQPLYDWVTDLDRAMLGVLKVISGLVTCVMFRVTCYSAFCPPSPQLSARSLLLDLAIAIMLNVISR